MSCKQSKIRRQAKKLIVLIFFFFILCEILPLSGFSAEIHHSESEKATLPNEAKASERIFNLRGLSNVGRVSPGIYRGTQPLPEGYDTLKKMGVRTVINLRSKHSEKNTVEASGMKSIEVPFSVLKDVNIEKVNSLIDIMINPDNQPVYVHCKLGQDRTGIVIAAYRIRVDRWSLKEAEAEMQAFGFNDLWYELKEFIRKYAKSLSK